MYKKFFAFFAAALLAAVLLIAACPTADIDELPDEGPAGVPTDAVKAQLPFSKGVNFNGWLDDRWNVPPKWFTDYEEKHFQQVKGMGVDVIRLTLALHHWKGHTCPGCSQPWSQSSRDAFVEKLDEAVDLAEKYEIYLILNNHEFHPEVGVDETTEPYLLEAWTEIAERYKDRSDFVLYEILNEPHTGSLIKKWPEIQGRIIDAIREIDDKHWIVAGGDDYNDMSGMIKLSKYPHEKIVYTFHYYYPLLFCNYSEEKYTGIPFPYDPNREPGNPNLKELYNGRGPGGTWYNYPVKGTETELRRHLKEAVYWANKNEVPVFAGEFGSMVTQVDQEDRVRYYATITGLFRELNIPYINWGYNRNAYGLLKLNPANGNEYRGEQGGGFPANLNLEVIEAMGLTIPE